MVIVGIFLFVYLPVGFGVVRKIASHDGWDRNDIGPVGLIACTILWPFTLLLYIVLLAIYSDKSFNFSEKIKDWYRL